MAQTAEVIGARWSEIDLAAKLWTVPAGRMKAGKEHRVPLSVRAIMILGEMRQLIEVGDEQNVDNEIGSFIFPGGKRSQSLSNMAFLMLLRRMKRRDLTAHGFRSTFRDWAAERTNFPSEVSEMALAHTVSSKVEQALSPWGFVRVRRCRLMTAWSTYCAAPKEIAQHIVMPHRQTG